MPAWAERAVAACVALALAAGPAAAQLSDLVSRTAFRVCSDPANAPMSTRDGTGFENAIAELVAAELGRDLQYTWFPMAPGFVRRTLLENRCDVILGYAQGDELVLNTNHYYTSTHVLVTRAGDGLDAVDNLADPHLQGREIGVIAGTPAADHLARAGLLGTTHGYELMVDRRHQAPNQRMLADLLEGRLDAAILWGPIGGPLAQEAGAALSVTSLAAADMPRLYYRITMGVRNGEDAWKRELNSTIRALQPEIDAILRARGVPLLDDQGTGPKPPDGG